MFCVRQSSVRGCRFSFVFVYFMIKVFKCSPVPASFFPYLSTSLHWCPKPGRKEGHAVREPSLLSGIAVLRSSGSRKKRRPPVAARGGGAGAMEEQVLFIIIYSTGLAPFPRLSAPPHSPQSHFMFFMFKSQ